jgi:hypothetical protein
VVELTSRIVRLSLADMRHVERQFTLVLNNGKDRVFCSLVSNCEGYLVARYSSEDGAKDNGFTSTEAALTADRWKGTRNRW